MNLTQNKFAAYIGIDWADQKHDICVSSSPESKPEHQQIASTPEALAEWLHQLRQRFPEGTNCGLHGTVPWASYLSTYAI